MKQQNLDIVRKIMDIVSGYCWSQKEEEDCVEILKQLKHDVSLTLCLYEKKVEKKTCGL